MPVLSTVELATRELEETKKLLLETQASLEKKIDELANARENVKRDRSGKRSLQTLISSNEFNSSTLSSRIRSA